MTKSAMHLLKASPTLILKPQREKIQQGLAHVELQYSLDPQLILDSLRTLVSTRKDVQSVLNLAGMGYAIYKSTTMAKDKNGNFVKKVYVIDQLTTCGDTIKSLIDGFSTRKDNSIAVDDPGAIKTLTTAGNIQKILNEFKNAIPKSTLDKINKELEDYMSTVQSRNAAVVEYNCCIQFLAESLTAEEYFTKQINNLGQQGLQINHLSRLLFSGSASRAIRYWGLQRIPIAFDPMPLQDFAFLADARLKLRKVFTKSLEQYAAKLTKPELDTLKAKPTSSDSGYTTYLRLNPATYTEFGDRIDIRLSEVRLWMLGVNLDADVTGRKILSVELIHTGEDIIQDTHRKDLKFSHDQVTIGFDYDVSKVTNLNEARTKNVFSKQNIQNDHYIGDKAGKNSIAALGPFTTWRLSVNTDRTNKELDMSGVTRAFLEFRWTSRAYVRN
ncbi:hypothetical protein N7517_009213 [Penicillium concentricum]|uniref:Uncharacterized protein n=1 Tax=Penicillium concentricum TaxID=293559 RepID=A0A9W9RGT3_9EURO|nr:uncharacterized protein N7517_009213 [Penicillium concentricum]KAJ5360022.1 hypothetical protein N7517_009213 [Penicillium concentricum]